MELALWGILYDTYESIHTEIETDTYNINTMSSMHLVSFLSGVFSPSRHTLQKTIHVSKEVYRERFV